MGVFLGDFLNIRSARGVIGRGKGREPLISLSPSRHSPRAAVFPLPRPTAKKPLRSKQHERGLCGGERF